MANVNHVPAFLQQYEGVNRDAHVIYDESNNVVSGSPSGPNVMYFAHKAIKARKHVKVFSRDKSGSWSLNEAKNAELQKWASELKAEDYDQPKTSTRTTAPKTTFASSLSNLARVATTLARYAGDGLSDTDIAALTTAIDNVVEQLTSK